jgi:hypothetical protein
MLKPGKGARVELTPAVMAFMIKVTSEIQTAVMSAPHEIRATDTCKPLLVQMGFTVDENGTYGDKYYRSMPYKNGSLQYGVVIHHGRLYIDLRPYYVG